MKKNKKSRGNYGIIFRSVLRTAQEKIKIKIKRNKKELIPPCPINGEYKLFFFADWIQPMVGANIT